MLFTFMFIRVQPPIPGSGFIYPPAIAGGYGGFEPISTADQVSGSFRPSIAVIIGVLVTMFSLTFLLLIYAKHCKQDSVDPSEDVFPPPLLIRDRDAGLDRAIIEALPIFSFSSLQGMKEGLECAVCLCKFEDTETLRLLPKCKHAFHILCVDTWLDGHPTCPLCRHRVEPQDVLWIEEVLPVNKLAMDESGSGRNSTGGSRSSTDIGTERVLQLYAQRDGKNEDASTIGLGVGSGNSDNGARKVMRISGVGSERRGGSERRDALLLADSFADADVARRLGHQIIVSDIVLQQRWSDFLPSDALFLRSHNLFGYGDHLSITESEALGSPNSNSRNESCRLTVASRIGDEDLPRSSVSCIPRRSTGADFSAKDVEVEMGFEPGNHSAI